MAGGERPPTGEDRFRRFMEGLREIAKLEKAPPNDPPPQPASNGERKCRCIERRFFVWLARP
jgi:hypothetical protein